MVKGMKKLKFVGRKNWCVDKGNAGKEVGRILRRVGRRV